MTAPARTEREPGAGGRFWRIAGAGVLFQGGAAAIEANTILAALVFGMTGSAVAVGAASAIARYGWLCPQIFIAYAAQRSLKWDAAKQEFSGDEEANRYLDRARREPWQL